MKLSLATLLGVVAAFAAAQTASNANAFNIPPSGNYLVHAGATTQLTWSNKQGSTVTLKLRKGSNGDLQDVSTIASHIPNTGSFSWSVPAGTAEGSTYAIEIINDDSPQQVNYTPQFPLLSNTKAGASSAASGSAASSGSPTSAPASSSPSAASASGATKSSGTVTSKGKSKATSTGSASSKAAASSTSKSAAASTKSAASPTKPATKPSDNPAPVLKVGGSLLAVAVGFAVAF